MSISSFLHTAKFAEATAHTQEYSSYLLSNPALIEIATLVQSHDQSAAACRQFSNTLAKMFGQMRGITEKDFGFKANQSTQTAGVGSYVSIKPNPKY